MYAKPDASQRKKDMLNCSLDNNEKPRTAGEGGGEVPDMCSSGSINLCYEKGRSLRTNYKGNNRWGGQKNTIHKTIKPESGFGVDAWLDRKLLE